MLETLIAQLGNKATVDILDYVQHGHHKFPLYSISLGSNKTDVPVLAFFGGVHGLEKIGSEIIFAYLQTIIQQLQWDEEFQARLEKSRLVFFPLVNPVGVFQGSRSNGNGVDLMRNSPVRCTGERKIFSGHRLSPYLPWYQGDPTQMEIEAEAVCKAVRTCLLQSPLTITIDLHSGFGIQDRLWFPYAYSQQPYPGLAETYAWKQLFDRTYPHHFYKIEPTSKEYVIEGDLWDYLYLDFLQTKDKKQVFLPLTLEMGSWRWLRKSPRHLFSRHGLFHPLLPHRQQRILRRHLILFDFLYRSLLNPKHWAYLDTKQKQDCYQQAMTLWHEK
ncbi:MAG: M14 family zinc carboxypeptidase [Methyloglobulus sp.]